MKIVIKPAGAVLIVVAVSVLTAVACWRHIPSAIKTGAVANAAQIHGDASMAPAATPAAAGLLNPNQFYKLISRRSGLAMTVSQDSPYDGAWMVQQKYFGNPNQQWKVVASGDGYSKILSRSSNKAIDCYVSTDRIVHVMQRGDSGLPAQQWNLAYIGNDSFKIVNRSNGKAMDGSTSIKEDTPVLPAPDSGAVQQQWQIVPVTDDASK